MSGSAEKVLIGTHLSEGWRAEFGHLDRHAWHGVIAQFDDANLYQTWPYDRLRFKRQDVVHMVLRRQGAIVAAAQARIVRVPGTRVGIAYVRWGPMWRPLGGQAEPEVFRRAARALRDEFSRRRGLVLRLYPRAWVGADGTLTRILEEEGYLPFGAARTDRTLVIDLAPGLDVLRSGLDQKWRNCLNRAERNGLEVVAGSQGELFDAMAMLYRQMVARKVLTEASDIEYLKRVQRDLPDELKLRVVICSLHGVLCAGGVFSAIGSTGLYVRGATSDAGLKTNGSYLVQWTFLRWLKDQGARHYDLNGINPEANPGTYHFKQGLAGRHGSDREFLGRFQVADRSLSEWVVRGGERVVACWHGLVRGARSAPAMISGTR